MRIKMPQDLQSLLQACLKLPDPTRFFLTIVIAQRSSHAVRRQTLTLVGYPLLMIGFAAGTCAFIAQILYNAVNEGFADWGLRGFDEVVRLLDDQRKAFWATFAIMLWCIVTGLTIRFIGPRWAMVSVVGGLPIVGRPLRWLGLHEILVRFQAVTQQSGEGLSLSASTVADSLHGSDYQVVSQLIARRIGSGMAPGLAFSQSMLSDGLCKPALLSIDRSSDLSSGCGQVADMLKRLAEERCRAMGTLMPMFVLITIGTMVWGTIGGYMAMLRLLLSMLSSLMV
jgi:type II secretory pathway component PulF